jgi:DNA modification methylase
MIHTGDCIEVMAGMPADSVDAVVTDPPYGIGFMGKTWDAFDASPVESSWSGKGRNTDVKPNPTDKIPNFRYSVSGTGFRETNPRCGTCGRVTRGRDTAKGFKVCHCETPVFAPTKNRDAARFQQWCELWGAQAFRVTKPGGYLLAFGGTRTHHRLVCGLEDAGWIIRDELDWIYASGFPKGKANLKPAHEPIVLARKPGPLRPLAIDSCRIPGAVPQTVHGVSSRQGEVYGHFRDEPEPSIVNEGGRWPSNVLLSSPELFDQPNPYVVGSGATATSGLMRAGTLEGHESYGGFPGREMVADTYGDSGGYSRFFRIPQRNAPAQGEGAEPEGSTSGVPDYPTHYIIPKADRADREPVLRGQLAASDDPFAVTAHGKWCEVCGKQAVNVPGSACQCEEPQWTTRAQRQRENAHPTVKPTDLMRHLVRLVTPSGGTVLDCFAGSGSTLLAAEMEGFAWIGIEQDASYVAIAEARLNGTQRGLGLDVGAPTKAAAQDAPRPL